MSDYGLLTPQKTLGLVTQVYNLQQAHVRQGRENARWFVEQKKLKLEGQGLDEAQKAFNEGTADREQHRKVSKILQHQENVNNLRKLDDDARRDPAIQNTIRASQQRLRNIAGDITETQTKIKNIRSVGPKNVSESIAWTTKFAEEKGFNKTDTQFVNDVFPPTMMHVTGNGKRAKEMQYKPQDAVGDAAKHYDWKPIEAGKEFEDKTGTLTQIQRKATERAQSMFETMGDSPLPMAKKKRIAVMVAVEDHIEASGLSDEAKQVAVRNMAQNFEEYTLTRQSEAITKWQGEYYKTVAEKAGESADTVHNMIKNMTPHALGQIVTANSGVVEAVNQINTLMDPGQLDNILADVEARRPVGADGQLPTMTESIDFDGEHKDNYAKFAGGMLNSLRANVNRAGAEASAEVHGVLYNNIQRSLEKGTLADDYPQISSQFKSAYEYWIAGEQQKQASNYAKTNAAIDKGQAHLDSTGQNGVWNANMSKVMVNVPQINITAGDTNAGSMPWISGISAEMQNALVDGEKRQFMTPPESMGKEELTDIHGNTVANTPHPFAYGIDGVGLEQRDWSFGNGWKPGTGQDSSNPFLATKKSLEAQLKIVPNDQKDRKALIEKDVDKADFMGSNVMTYIADLKSFDQATFINVFGQENKVGREMGRVQTASGNALNTRAGFNEIHPIAQSIQRLSNNLEQGGYSTQERQAMDMKLQLLWAQLNEKMGLSFAKYSTESEVEQGYRSTAGLLDLSAGQTND